MTDAGKMTHAGKYAHHSYQGWRVTCECGWESDVYPTRDEANAALERHIVKVTLWLAGGVS